MHISSATFIKSSVELKQLPENTLPEFAFIGRSNVGKSSLINMLTSRKELAKTSGSPGKTQTINHFLINKSWYLVDLPGYGFAKVSQEKRADWQKMIRNYLTRRENLMNIFVLADLRIAPQASDISFINWLGEQEIPLSLVFTKSDKLSKKQVTEAVEKYREKMLESWDEMPPTFLTSAETRLGRDQVLNYIDECLPLFKKEEL